MFIFFVCVCFVLFPLAAFVYVFVSCVCERECAYVSVPSDTIFAFALILSFPPPCIRTFICIYVLCSDVHQHLFLRQVSVNVCMLLGASCVDSGGGGGCLSSLAHFRISLFVFLLTCPFPSISLPSPRYFSLCVPSFHLVFL